MGDLSINSHFESNNTEAYNLGNISQNFSEKVWQFCSQSLPFLVNGLSNDYDFGIHDGNRR